MVQSLIRDQNRVVIAGGQSNTDSTVVLPLLIDGTTGRVLVDNSSTSTIYSETPSGTIDGSNVTFTTAHTINTVYSFAINGQYIHPTVDYTTSGVTITFVVAPDAGLSGTGFTIVYS
jgi:hypothetical protein